MDNRFHDVAQRLKKHEERAQRNANIVATNRGLRGMIATFVFRPNLAKVIVKYVIDRLLEERGLKPR